MFPLDFESVFYEHLAGEIFSFDFCPKAVYVAYKFWISRSAITHVQNLNLPIGPRTVGSREKRRRLLASLKFQRVTAAYYSLYEKPETPVMHIRLI